jgi:hypothetical protein
MDFHGTISNRSERILAKRFNLCTVSTPKIQSDHENTGYCRPNYLFFIDFSSRSSLLHMQPAQLVNAFDN